MADAFLSALAQFSPGVEAGQKTIRDQAELERQRRRQEQQDALSQTMGALNIETARDQQTDRARKLQRETDAPALIAKARAGDADAIGQVIAQFPQLADEFRPAKPVPDQLHYDAERGGMVNERTNTFTPTAGLPAGSPKAPVMGSQKWKDAKRFEASLVPREDKTLVAVQDPNDPTRSILVPRSQAAGMALPTKTGGPAQSATVKEKIANLHTSLDMLNQAEEGVKAMPNAVGWKGYLPNAILDRTQPEGVPIRAAIEAFAGELRHERFGGALTPGEAARAAKFLPSETDASDVALKKLAVVKDFITKKIGYLDGSAPVTPLSGGPKGAPSDATRTYRPENPYR